MAASRSSRLKSSWAVASRSVTGVRSASRHAWRRVWRWATALRRARDSSGARVASRRRRYRDPGRSVRKAWAPRNRECPGRPAARPFSPFLSNASLWPVSAARWNASASTDGRGRARRSNDPSHAAGRWRAGHRLRPVRERYRRDRGNRRGCAQSRSTSSQISGTDRQPSWNVANSSDAQRISGLMKAIGFLAPSRWSRSITSTRLGTPTWMAARPMPSAAYMLSIRSSMSLRVSSSTRATELGDRFPGRGSGAVRMGRSGHGREIGDAPPPVKGNAGNHGFCLCDFGRCAAGFGRDRGFCAAPAGRTAACRTRSEAGRRDPRPGRDRRPVPPNCRPPRGAPADGGRADRRAHQNR